MDQTDECFLDVPEPPPWPPGQPVPLDLEYGTPGWERKRRLHRLARLNGACPECDGGPEEPTVQEFLRGLARPRPMKPDEVPVDGGLLTPEGEVASFVHGRPEVEDREAFTRWSRSALTPVGQAFAHVASVDGVPWLRALLWFAHDDRLHVEASSLDRYFHVEVTLEYLWPPVYRGSRTLSRLDERLDAPYRPEWPAPPVEASVFTRLTPIDPSDVTPAGGSTQGQG